MAKLTRTWWGTKFMDSLSGFMEEGRLKRGRSYSGPHRILSFEIQDNIIKSKVRGNVNPYFGVYKEPQYKVTLNITPISSKKWSIIIKNIATNAGWLSKLMLNEMPDNIESAFSGLNECFLPESSKDLVSECSCPDWANPCKHVAGVYFRIAAMLDENPFLMFQLRGLSQKELQSSLAKTDLGKALLLSLVKPEEIPVKYDDFFYSKPELQKLNEKINLKHFWEGNSIDKQDKVFEQANISALVIKKHGDFPSFWTKETSFITAMESIYEHIRAKNKTTL